MHRFYWTPLPQLNIIIHRFGHSPCRMSSTGSENYTNRIFIDPIALVILHASTSRVQSLRVVLTKLRLRVNYA